MYISHVFIAPEIPNLHIKENMVALALAELNQTWNKSYPDF